MIDAAGAASSPERRGEAGFVFVFVCGPCVPGMHVRPAVWLASRRERLLAEKLPKQKGGRLSLIHI